MLQISWTTASILTKIKCICSSKRSRFITRLRGRTCRAQSASHGRGSDQTLGCVRARGVLTRLARRTPSRPFCSGNQCGTSVSGVMSLHIRAHGWLFVARVGALSYAERQSLPIVTVQGWMIASEENLQTTQTQAY